MKSQRLVLAKKYNLLEPWKTLDPWQKKYIKTEGNCFLLCGRQSGKTAAMSIKFGERAAKRKNRTILMIALTEKQAYNLFFKTLMYLEARYPKMIKKGRWKATKHRIYLKNGSQIMCYAAGKFGEGLRTYTVTDLVVDEAAPMAREVFIAITPMLAVTGGTMDLSSTPRGKAGFFFECSDQCKNVKKNWTRFYVSAEDCPRHKKEYLEDEKKSMSKLEYAQEYLARFLDELRQFFPTALIKECMVLQRCTSLPNPASTQNFLGVDVARMGEDQTVLFSVCRINREKLRQIDMEVTTKTRLTETIRRIKHADNRYNYKKIFIDDGGMGVGVFDPLLEDEQTKRKVIPINNARRSLDNEEKGQRTKLMKEDLYNNLLNLMEKGAIELFDDEEIMLSLKSIQYEYTDGNKLRLSGRYSHIAEALIRAAWCMRDKSLNIYIY